MLISRNSIVTVFTILLVIYSVSAAGAAQNMTEQEKEKIIFDQFQKFVKAYNKTYSSAEEMNARIEVFKDNYKRLEAKLKKKNFKHAQGISPFFDLTRQEFKRSYLNLNVTLQDIIVNKKYEGSLLEDLDNGAAKSEIKEGILPSDLVVNKPSNGTGKGQGRLLQTTSSLPTNFNWANYIPIIIKNQGSCGDCWAFSATAAVQARHCLKTGISVSLSEQQLMDCDTNSSGCNGGTAYNAFYYLRYYSNGQVKESDYPYLGYQTTCNVANFLPVTQVSGWIYSGSTDENNIKLMVYYYGPLSVAINAKYLETYRSGIINVSNTDCNPNDLNHAVNIVGWGTENGVDYWIVQNSWSQYWGEKGFFRIVRGTGCCGINQIAITAIVS